MPFFGVPIRNGLPIGLGSVAGFGVQQFDPSQLFEGGTVAGAWYDPSDSTTLFSDRAGTTPCGTPGGGSVVPVGAMLDERAPNYSVLFDGNGDWLETPDSAAFDLSGGPYTLEAWIYPDGNYSDYRTILAKRQATTTTTAWQIYLAITTGRFGFYNGTLYESTTTPATNTWTHVAAVFDGTNINLYVGGTRVLQSAITNTNIAQPVRIGFSATGSEYFRGNISNVRVVKGVALYSGATITVPAGPLSPITGTSLLTCGTSWTGNPAITKNGDARVDGLNPFTASPVGNHAIAFNDTTARPELRARVNLLTYSEEFDNGAWTNLNAATNIVANATTAPNGTNTADFFRVAATTNADHLLRATNTVSVAAGTYILTWRIKANGISSFRMAVASETALTNRAWVNVNLSTRAQTGGNDGSGFTFVSSDVTLEDAYGFQTVSLTYTTTAGTAVPYIVMRDASGNFTFAGTVDTGLYIWGADLRPANIGANVPAYQRIADANTYDTSGFPLYLLFEGAVGQRGMYTPANLNLSGTDKVTVFAGVRKNTDPTDAMLTEFSAVFTNAGSFAVAAPWTSTTLRSYFVAVRGSAINSRGYTGYPAPISNVLTASITTSAADSDAAQDVRINAVDVAGSSIQSAASTGNFGTYPLYIGARNNSSLWLNGHLYSLAVVGSAVSGGNIAAMESWVAGKTGIAI